MRFNAKKAEAVLRQRLLAALAQLQEEFLNEIRSHTKMPEAAESWHEGDIGEIGNVLWAEVVGGAWAAMDSWGTGSLMDTSNPALADYMASDLWNPARTGTTIVTRPSGTWTDIFGETHHKGGNHPGGYDLERAGKVQPQPPSHALETAARWMKQGRVQRVLQQVIADMPWHQFFEEERG